MKRLRRGKRMAAFLLLLSATLWAVSSAAQSATAAEAFRALREESFLPRTLLHLALGDATPSPLSLPTTLVLNYTPVFTAQRSEILATWSSELQQFPSSESEDSEGTILTRPPSPAETLLFADNGISARTLRPGDAAGYTVVGKTYINNASTCPLSPAMLAGGFAAHPEADGPLVLLLHTHGTEAYTMPAGEEYVPSDESRTLEEEKNMLRIGDEIAAVLEEAGLSVLHDRTLHDYPNYSGAYNRSLATAQDYLDRYPTITYILDIHRDAVEDADGRAYKLLCEEEPRAAQMEFVLGSSGGGLEHDLWQENLKLAVAVQETLLTDYPTLMRPIILRSSRYNQHLSTGALLLEVGTAGNSLDEALFAARLFAEGFAKTVLAEA